MLCRCLGTRCPRQSAPLSPRRAARSLIQTRHLPDVQRWLATLAAFREAPGFATADVALRHDTERLHGELQAAQDDLTALLERVASGAGLHEALEAAEGARAAAEARARSETVRDCCLYIAGVCGYVVGSGMRRQLILSESASVAVRTALRRRSACSRPCGACGAATSATGARTPPATRRRRLQSAPATPRRPTCATLTRSSHGPPRLCHALARLQ